MAIVDITIDKVTSTVCTVSPGSAGLSLAAGDEVRWINNTNDHVIVFFPHDNVLGLGKEHFHKKIDRHGKYPHPGGAAQAGTFRYVIFCKETGTFAVGSDPEIVIA